MDLLLSGKARDSSHLQPACIVIAGHWLSGGEGKGNQTRPTIITTFVLPADRVLIQRNASIHPSQIVSLSWLLIDSGVQSAESEILLLMGIR